MKKKDNNNSEHRLTFWQRVKIKLLMFTLRITGKDKDYTDYLTLNTE